MSLAPQAAYMFFHMIPMSGSFDGHLTLMLQPERLTGATVGWFKYMLLGDSCGLCNQDADFEYGQHGLQ